MLETFDLSAFGAFHTAIALAAVFVGVLSLVRHGEITSASRAGLCYILLTAATSVTGLFIFRHGGFGAPHALALATLAVLGGSWLAERLARNHGSWRYVAVLGNSLTLFFHLIPGLTEGGTRLPLGSPAFSGPEDPALKALVGLGFLVYLAGAAWQAVRIRRASRMPLGAALP
jgi:Predicted membrane protein